MGTLSPHTSQGCHPRARCLQFMLDCRPFHIAGFNVETIGQLAHRDFASGAALRGGTRPG